MKRFISKKQFLVTITTGLVLLVILAACGPAEEGTAYPIENNTTGYPSLGQTRNPTTVAPSVNPAYPSEPSSEINESQRFNIERPVTADSTTVSGTAPSNMALAIVDITFGGTILGTGESDDDGRFTISVTPLPEGHRIGLTITDIQDDKTFEEVSTELYDYRGEEFMNVPTIGVFFDTAIIQP